MTDAARTLAEFYWHIHDTEKASKAIADELAMHLADALQDEDMAKDILMELAYWLQPYVNPYWQDK